MKVFQLFRTQLITSAVALLAIATLSGCAQSSQSQSVVNVTAKNVSMKNTSSNQSNTAHQVLSEFTVPKYVLLRNEQKAIEEPNNYQDQMSAAISYHLQGNDKKAIAYYEKLYKLTPIQVNHTTISEISICVFCMNLKLPFPITKKR